MFEAFLIRWRSYYYGLKFARKGRKCRIQGKHFTIEGHVECGDYCRFRDYVILRTHKDGKIIMGTHSVLSYYTILESTALIQIGSNTAIAEFTVIRDTNHIFWGTKEHFALTPHIAKPIIIGDNVLVGSRCYIHPGVEIGDGAIIGVGSVLVEDTKVGPLEIWAGVPARKVGHRLESVPPEKLQQTEELIKQYGIRKFRY
ncbi:MAG: acyltransferase [Candidatus Hydrogenedens sp.]|nr:acyltransferase [Candidatus Hydrogenedens sp.]